MVTRTLQSPCVSLYVFRCLLGKGLLTPDGEGVEQEKFIVFSALCLFLSCCLLLV